MKTEYGYIITFLIKCIILYILITKAIILYKEHKKEVDWGINKLKQSVIHLVTETTR